jgi:hypothetical protein
MSYDRMWYEMDMDIFFELRSNSKYPEIITATVKPAVTDVIIHPRFKFTDYSADILTSLYSVFTRISTAPSSYMTLSTRFISTS